MNKKIIVIGGGLSGLTVCHELIEKGFQVELYERSDILGGMARSTRTEYGVPSEHSWRGYAPFYYNTFELMKRIPLNKSNCNKEEFKNRKLTLNEVKKHNKINDLWTYYKNNVYDITNFVPNHPGGKIILKSGGKNLEKVWEENGVSWHKNNSNVLKKLKEYKIGELIETYEQKTVYDNLSENRLDFKLFYNDNTILKNKLPYKDYILVAYLFLKCMVSNKRKIVYDKKLFKKEIEKYVSEDGYHYLFDYLSGPGIGLDKNTMSLGHFSRVVEWQLQNDVSWQVMNQPTNEAWINPWVEYLKKNGLKIYLKSELKKIVIKKNKVEKLIINNNEKTADDYVICIDPFRFEEILEKSKIKKLKEDYTFLNTQNNQISFRFGFNKKINYGKSDAYVVIDSPYNITFYPQEIHWCKNIKLGMNEKIKSLWSGTCVLPYTKGILYKKSALELSKKELIEEIKEQIFISKSFQNYIKSKNKNQELKKEDIIFEEIFEDWYEEENGLKTKNKKWVNNIFNEEYRPKLEENPQFSNLYIGGSHTNTSLNIWSMESAIESGKIISNQILKKNNKKLTYCYKHESILILKILQKIDDVLYYLKLPNLIDLIILIIIIYIIYKIKNGFQKSKRN